MFKRADNLNLTDRGYTSAFNPVGKLYSGRTFILALGNPLCGDDGIGLAILKELINMESFPQGITPLDGSRSGLMNPLLGRYFQWGIIVDAVELGKNPGEWMRFTPNEIKHTHHAEDEQLTMHYPSIFEVMEIGAALGMKLPDIVIYGIQPLETRWSTGLSKPVQKAIPEVCEAIMFELTSAINSHHSARHIT